MSRLNDPVVNLKGTDLELYEALKAKRGHIHGMYRALLNHPALTKHVSALGTYLRFEATLPGDIREFIILSTAHCLKIDYEWMEHVKPARDAGLTDETLQAIKAGENIPAKYALFHQGLPYIVTLKNLPSAIQEDIIQQVSVKGLIEFVILVGFYRMIAGVVTAFDVPLPNL